MTRILVVIAVAALVVAWVPTTGEARPYGAGRYYNNPYTGAHASSGTAYNPLTGGAYHGASYSNPYTGRDVSTQRSYNPYTNTYSRSVEAYNPYTGRSAAAGGVYHP
jgi:hypothetical protein